jgi:hypothetical protein
MARLGIQQQGFWGIPAGYEWYAAQSSGEIQESYLGRTAGLQVDSFRAIVPIA